MDENILTYNVITKNKINNYIHVQFQKSFPTEEDYKKGYMKRYFAKKKNDSTNTILEISKESYEQISSGDSSTKILFRLLSIKWFITGPINNVYDKNNTLKYEGVVEKNSKIVNYKNPEFLGLKEYLDNSLEFYR